MAEEPMGCAKPTGAVVGETRSEGQSSEEPLPAGKKMGMVAARVGGKAPDFEAPAFHKGEFTKVRLSDYLGKWVLLCFYPGDFTFV